MAVLNAKELPMRAKGVRERVDAVIELCAQKQLGMSYDEHIATLTIDSVVTWTDIEVIEELGGNVGTIGEVLEGIGHFGVRVPSREGPNFSATALRTPQPEWSSRRKWRSWRCMRPCWCLGLP